jgi:succinoglycan biosynthesis transport protein ExoP
VLIQTNEKDSTELPIAFDGTGDIVGSIEDAPGRSREVLPVKSQAEKELTLRDLLQIYHRRRSVVYGVLLTLCILAGIYCTLCTRRYEATGTVQVQKEGADAMGLDTLMSSATGGGSGALEDNIESATQANILQSDTLALRTIESLGMEDTYDFRQRWKTVAQILSKISLQGVPDPAGAKLEEAPQRRQRALKIFSKNLKVKPVSGTRLIEITYSDPDPKLAAAVVNTLTRVLSDYTFQTRYDATSQASKWLSDQLGDLRKDSEDLQAKVVNMQRQSGVYSLGIVDAQGREQAYSGVLDQLQQATSAMNTAAQNRILKGAIAEAAATGNAEMLSGLAGNTMAGSSQMMNNSLSLIQNLRQQQATEQAALQEAQAKFGPAYPKIAELQGNIAGLEHSIQQEIGRIKIRAKSDFEIAAHAEASTRQNYETAKNQADILNNKAIEFAIVRQEADDSRGLYEDLLKRLKEAGVLQGLRSSNITVVDPGRAPAKPKSPNVPLYMAIALCGGWFLGCCGALLADTLDNKVNSVHELEALFKESTLGVLPLLELSSTRNGSGRKVLALDEPQSTYVEAMRSIRSALLLSRTGAPPKVLLITSGIAGEGKSLCAINLATILAQTGRRTLLIDTDLRRGSLRRRFDLPRGPGLSDLLAGQQSTPPIQPVPGIENLDILIAGTTPPNPSDLLQSDSMRTWLQVFRSQYDFIVLDSAPVLPVSDSVELNTLTDATLLLVRARVTERPQVERSYQILRQGGKHYVGLVLNGLSVHDSSYYGYYGYRNNAYPYAEKNGHVTA